MSRVLRLGGRCRVDAVLSVRLGNGGCVTPVCLVEANEYRRCYFIEVRVCLVLNKLE